MNLVVTEARALLEQFRHGPWHDMYLRTSGFALFVAKPGGAANPLRRAAPRPAAAVTAPHIGTVAWVAEVGSRVEVGIVVCHLEVLGESVEIKADRAGMVAAIATQPGTLAEYGATIVMIAIQPD